MENINLEAVAQEILETVDYDIAKEDEFMDNQRRDEIEFILGQLVKDVISQLE